MKNIMTLYKWLNLAVSGIRFGPDRKAVRAELAGHIEDRAADLMRIFPDMEEREAQERALAAMGDPEELKISLARVHRPWLGYLWRASQVLLALVVFAVLATGNGPDIRSLWAAEEPSPDRPEPVTLEPDKTRVKTDGFTITMTEAYLYTHEYPEGAQEHRLIVTLRRTSPMFWCRGGGIDGRWNNFITAEDSLGNYYPSYYECKTEPRYRAIWEYIWPNERDAGLFHSDYGLMIPLKDPDAEWVRLDYDWMGRSFSMKVDLKEAGV